MDFDHTMSDRQILDRLAKLPRTAYAARCDLYRVWFSENRPKPCNILELGGVFDIDDPTIFNVISRNYSIWI